MSVRTGFGEHNIRTTTVSGGTLTQHRGTVGTAAETTARRLLAYDDSVDRVRVATHKLEVYLRERDAVGWTAPDGYEISQISAFVDADEWGDNQCVIVSIREGEA